MKYLDESDGSGFVTVSVEGIEVANWSLNQDTDSEILRTISGVTINNGEIIDIQGIRNAGEYARIDYIEITNTQ